MVDVFSLRLQRDNRQNALAVAPAKGKTGEKGCIFHRTVEMKQPHTMTQPFEKVAVRICSGWTDHEGQWITGLPFFDNGWYPVHI